VVAGETSLAGLTWEPILERSRGREGAEQKALWELFNLNPGAAGRQAIQYAM